MSAIDQAKTNIATNQSDLDLLNFANQKIAMGESLDGITEKFQNANTATKNFVNTLTTQIPKGQGALENLKNIGGQFISTLVNGFVSFAASAAISLIITGVSKLADKLIMTRKEAESLSNQFDETFSSTASEQAKTAKTIADIEDEYEKLSQGVSVLGENISLTDEEFERYHEITQIIADNIPSLIQGYDDQGQAIIRLKGNVESLTEAYKENQQAAALDLYNQTNEDGNVIKGVYKNAQNNIQDEFYEELSSSDSGRTINHTANIQQQLEMRKQLATATHDQLKELYETNAYAKFILQDMMREGYDIASDNETDIAKVHSQLQKDATELETTLEADARRVAEAGLTYAQAYQGYYTELTSEQQKYVNSIMNTMDFDYVYKNGLFDQDAMEKYVQDLMDVFKNLSPDKLESINLGVDITTAWNNNELSYEEYIQKLKEFDALLEQLFPGNELIQKSIKVLFDMPEEISDLENENNTLFNRRDRVIKTKFEQKADKQENLLSSAPSTADILGGQNPIEVPYRYVADEKSMTDSRSAFEKWFAGLKTEEQEFVRGLSDEELELTAGLNLDEEFDEWLAKLQEIADQNPIEITAKASDLVSDLKDIEDAFGGLGEIESAGTSASASDIEQVNSDMGGVTFGKYGDGTSIEDVNAMSSALEKYNKVLTDNKSTTEDVDKATDDLVTSYLDLSGKLDNITEETKDKTIEELKSYGIENAEEVVVTRLNKVYKNFSKNLQTLSTKVAQYHDTLEEGVNADGFDEAAEDIAKTVTEMFKVTDEAGNEIAPTIDTSFIESNLNDIKLAAEGDIDAIARLRVEAAKTIDVDINVNDDELYDAWSGVANAIANLDGTQFVIGGYMDDTAIISALNNILATGKYTVSEFKKMVSEISGGSISAEVQWETKTVDLPTPQFSFGNWKSSGGGNITSDNAWKFTTTKVHYSMPKFQYKYNGGTGAGANYGGGGNSSSSGSGGGDSGGSSSEANKKTEDDKEVYDWIEKYLNNLEDELDKLDDKVNDTYDNWTNRNKNVGKEIENITKQIKANQTAQKDYEKYANSLKVNNGETKVNDDDYGDNDTEQKTYDQSQLDAANKIWNGKKGDEYKKLIQEGKLGKDDIETIQNKYLRDVLSEYETWWNKAKDAGDKAISLSYDLKAKYEDLFNNVSEDYDEMISLIEKRSDIVATRISRMETNGWFVNKNYYEEQLQYTNEILAKHQSELTDLVTKYNNAITTGGIDSTSEAARKMREQILTVQNEIGQDLEEQITIKNNIRQLGWDKFDWLIERLERINKEAEHFSNIFSHYKQTDEQGNFTNEGWANITTDIASYETRAEELSRYEEEFKKLEDQLSNKYGGKYREIINGKKEDADPFDKEIIAQMDTIQDAAFETREAMLDDIDSVKSKIQEAFDANLAYLNKTIDKYKETMQEAKDLYDYQRNIENQTKDIMKLEKQMAAYRGDNSEEGRKKSIELQQKYNTAQEQLKTTEWDKYISETNDMLDNLYTDYEEYLTKYLDNFDQILPDIKSAIEKNPEAISLAIQSRLTEFEKETALGSNLANLQNLKINIDGVGNVIVEAIKSSIGETLKNAVTQMNSATKAMNEANDKNVKTNSNGTMSVTNAAPSTNTTPGLSSPSIQTQIEMEAERRRLEEENRKIVMDEEDAAAKAKAEALAKERAKKWVDGNFYDATGQKILYTGGTWKHDSNGYWYEYIKNGKKTYLKDAVHTIDGAKVKFNSKGYVTDDYVDVVAQMISGLVKIKNSKSVNTTGTITALKLASGRKRLSHGGIYETNEADTGSELIYRTSSGGILTPLDSGDMVFSHEMSQRLWDIAANNIPVGSNVQMIDVPENINGGTYNINAETSITLPNVKNYDDFKRELQKDNNFEKFIQEITVGRLNGNNSMNKRKY